MPTCGSFSFEPMHHQYIRFGGYQYHHLFYFILFFVVAFKRMKFKIATLCKCVQIKMIILIRSYIFIASFTLSICARLNGICFLSFTLILNDLPLSSVYFISFSVDSRLFHETFKQHFICK